MIITCLLLLTAVAASGISTDPSSAAPVGSADESEDTGSADDVDRHGHGDRGEGGRGSIAWLDPSAIVTFPDGWSAAACSESAPLICVERDGVRVGVIEAGAFPIETFSDPDLARRRPLRFLRDRAHEAEESHRADRAEVCGADYAVDATGPARRRVMQTRGVGFGFEGGWAGAPTTELVVVHLAVIDDHVVSVTASAHDPTGCIGAEGAFTVEELQAFRRHLRTLVATLPAPTFLWDGGGPVAGAPAVAVGVGDDTVVVDAEGEEVVRIPLLEKATLDGTVLAGIGPGGGAGIAPGGAGTVPGGDAGTDSGDSAAATLGISTNAFDTTTGNQLWTAVHTRAGIVLDEGRRVALLPDVWGQRDPQVNSIWMREEDGTERLVVQFANGPGLPGYDPGFEGDNGMLSVSFDDDASVAVVTQGNDVSLFVYDVFAVDVATGEVRPLTAGKRSRAAAVSPDGGQVAFERDLGPCGPDQVRAADLVVLAVDGSSERTLSPGSCAEWYAGPRWVSPSEVAAFRHTADGVGGWTTDVVVLDIDAGTAQPLTSDGAARSFTVDADERRIVVQAAAADRFTLIDLDGGDPVELQVVGATGVPRLAGDHQWP